MKINPLFHYESYPLLLQAGGMDRARQSAKIRDAEKESQFGYVYAVSGPGKFVESKMQLMFYSSFGVIFKV